MTPRALVCQPDSELAEVIRRLLHDSSIAMDVVSTGGALLARRTFHDLALVVVDLLLPDAHGFDVCRWLRKRSDVPVVMLARCADPLDTVVALEIGADDCIGVPFDGEEFGARVRATMRRSGATLPGRGSADTLRLGDLELDTRQHTARLGAQSLDLTPKEFDLLHALLLNAGKVVRSRDLLMQVWGYGDQIRTRTLDVHVGRLRAKIEPDRREPRYIVTVPAVGYKLERQAA
jgi:DNA-binding response OmpR family regulator